MPILKLIVRSSLVDPFDVEIDSEETVEALSIVAYSMRLELGEDLRVVHKAKILAADLSLAAAGVRNGDAVAMARRTPPSVSDAVKPKVIQAAESPAAAEPAAATEPASATKPVAATKSAAVEPAAATESEAVEPPGPDPVGVEPAATEPAAAEPAAAEPAAAQPAAVEQSEHESAELEITDAPAVLSDAEGEGHGEEENLDDVSPESLLALAKRFDSADAVPPAEAARLVRRAAARVEMLMGVVGELGQSLQMVNFLSARTLRGLEGRLSGTSAPSAGIGAAEADGDSGRSFLHKRGDADVQEAHRAQSLKRPSSSGPCSWGGTPDSETIAKKPKTKEEMDQARRDRLDQLEAQQAAKKKQLLEADAKSAATKAMFEKRDHGKPLGKN